MKIGIPKELKNNESRVGMTPAGVYELTAHGHEVFVQQSAGEKSGFPDESYRKAGAKVLPTIEEVYAIADMIVKVKEPLSWVMLAPIELLNSLRGIPLTVVTQRFSPSPSTVISVLPSSNPSSTSSELQDDSEPKPSPRLTWVISMVLFSWISNS